MSDNVKVRLAAERGAHRARRWTDCFVRVCPVVMVMMVVVCIRWLCACAPSMRGTLPSFPYPDCGATMILLQAVVPVSSGSTRLGSDHRMDGDDGWAERSS